MTEKEEALKNLLLGIPKCGCGELGEPDHACPFSEEIHQCQDVCNCCVDCHNNCADDV